MKGETRAMVQAGGALHSACCFKCVPDHRLGATRFAHHHRDARKPSHANERSYVKRTRHTLEGAAAKTRFGRKSLCTKQIFLGKGRGMRLPAGPGGGTPNAKRRTPNAFPYFWRRAPRPLGRVYLMGRFFGSIFVIPVPFLSSRI